MQNVKGTYDFLGEDQSLRRAIRSVLEEVFALYDFNETDSTVLNELELLTSKYAGGDEIVKEMYQLTDQGSRKLGLRYDLTIPFAKIMALNPGIELPYKRYEIGKVFRDGPVKKGRLREFLQCDADVVGTAGPAAEAELMQLAVEVFRRLDIPITLKWNNRQLLGEILEAVGVASEQKLSVMLTLDKLDKIGRDGVIKELAGKNVTANAIDGITELIGMDSPTIGALTRQFGLEQSRGQFEAALLQDMLVKLNLEQTCQYDLFLSRGLSFYTGTVYEIFDASKTFGSSLGGGGRYDAIIGQLVGRDDIQYPTVGLSFGMESIMEMMRHRPVAMKLPQVAVIPIGDTMAAALNAAGELRASGIRTRLEASGRKLKKSLAAASAKGIRYVVLIGEEEAVAGKVRLKDMQEMTEHVVFLSDAVKRCAAD
ncbi:histidine--tRNA ligase [Paenibacillaceae bacterium]|nr:histidine--tRNA ligase [Paenibacillaceae bacterium]